jgi:uncharacterized protein (DUF3084 family)
MYAQANHRAPKAATSSESGPAEILEAVGALREYMRSMDQRVKELMSERSRLAAEVDRLNAQRSEPPWQAGAERVTSELDDLVRLYETTARRRARSHTISGAPSPSSAPAPDQGIWFKKMVMLLMMSDLV